MRGAGTGSIGWAGALLAAALCACGTARPGSEDAGGLDAGEVDGGEGDAGNVDHGAPSSTFPAFDIDWPQLLGSDAGVIASPRLVVVTFDGDSLRAELERFSADLGSTDYWRETTAEYGVGVPSNGAPVHLAMTPPTLLDDQDIQTFLTLQLDGSHPEWPAPDDRTVYLLYYPATTRVLMGGLTSCTNFGAYHSALTVGGALVPYAVMPRCPPNPNVAALSTQLGLLTGVTAHEIIEAVTDVHPGVLPGYRLPTPQHMAFVTFAGAETGDMCQFNPAAWIVDPQLNATVQRSWSNLAAKAGREPCVPAGNGPFFTAVPVMPDQVSMTLDGVSLETIGLKLAVGQSATVPLLLVSSADTGGPFTITAMDRQAFFGQPRALTFRLDRTQGVNGEKVYLTITRTGNDPNFGGAIPFTIIASQGDVKTYWFSMVGAP